MIFLAYEIVREGQEHGAKWFCKTESWERLDKHAIEEEAERVRNRYDNTYGGKHFVIRHWESRPVAERFVRNRQESLGYRDLAFAEILDGPETKTRRWLEKYLAAKERMKQAKSPRASAIADAKQEPVAVGQVLDDVPF